ncbi:YkyA family protein [Virgibacillus litoralis]|uniref:Chromosome segregation ATPase n=1 Tax=Virgibacillus litoralis TaxID=578221 RepID=A0ABS4HCV1_9BACI|nr:chromosome segregation ATPase [Virgibacillus litoralis]
MVFKKSFLILLLFILAILTACSGASTSEQIYDHLEKAVELEDTFVKQQDPIVELEKKEQEIYSQIIDLGMNEFEQIKELSNQAIENIEKRKEKIELEKESIAASKEEFTKIESMIEDLEQEDAQKNAKEMYSVMTDRYNAYDKLYQAYSETLKLEKDLYTMLQKEDLEQETLTKHITKVNDSYQQVIAANETFNERTTEYNALKEEFYSAAGIDAEYENNAPTGEKNSTE